VNYLLIAVCCAAFLYQLSLGAHADGFIGRWAVVPANVTAALHGHDFMPGTLLPLFTSLFLHGGWMHLIGNMIYLYVFGDNVEDRLGHAGYFVFYLLCGLGASLAQVFMGPESHVPMIGASGAIAGVLGAYFILFPRARVLTVIPLFIFFPTVELSAFFLLGFWFVMQFLQGALAMQGSGAEEGVAWWAHAGGFVAGALLLPVFLLVRRVAAK
jgi:membrane associated rhomboid family serine protease